jgi:fumarate reductase subunit C
MESLVHLVIYLIVVGCILGLLLYLVAISPVPEPWKGWLHFLVVAIAVVIVIYILLGLVSGGSVPRLHL